MAGSSLVVFDFDWSLVNENSDTWVIKVLTPELVKYMETLRADQAGGYYKQWTKLMDHLVSKMMQDENITLEQLNKALESIPVFAETITAIKLAQNNGAQLAILSDANEHYINIILKHLGIDCFPMIVTNLATVEQFEENKSVLRISPFQPLDEPHNCDLCPSNLCKGQVLRNWLNAASYERVIYVGDGRGDFCPSMLLSESDFILCRNSWALHTSLTSAQPPPQAKILPWDTGEDILHVFRSLFPLTNELPRRTESKVQ